MPKKKASEVVEKPTPPVVTGHIIKPRYREFECDWVDLEEGEEPFKATIRTNLSFAEVNELPPVTSLTYAETWELMAPHITSWNLVAYVHETGEVEPVPPPAEAGVDVFRATDPLYSQWLYVTLQLAHQGGVNGVLERKNASGPSGDGPEHENSDD